MFDVRLGRFRGVMRCMLVVAVSQVGMVCGQFVAAGLVVLCCFLMMACCVFVVLCRLVMMFRCLPGHEIPPLGRREKNPRNGAIMQRLLHRFIAEASLLGNDPVNAQLWTKGVPISPAAVRTTIRALRIAFEHRYRHSRRVSLARRAGDLHPAFDLAVYLQRGFL